MTSTANSPHPGFRRFSCIQAFLIVLLCAWTPQNGFSQTLKTIRGTVTAAPNATPMQGVSVRIKGTERGTTTDASGGFSLSAASTEVLTFSYIGYTVQEIKVGGNTSISVSLTASGSSMDDVLVIGYGTVRRKDLTGSVGTVNMADISKAPVGSFAEALAGRVAGMQVTTNDGQPGGSINITIRGPGSLTQNTSPLYVIDGIPVENVDPATLNTEEIESMTVLKDASSTAIYGSRAANGVILIQTKRGKSGKPVVSFTTQYGYQLKPQMMELMSPTEFIQYQLELNPNLASTAAFFAGGKKLEDYDKVKPLDMQDHLFRNGENQSYNLAVRGGSEQTKYSISGAYFNQIGSIINTGFKRYSGRVTLDQTISRVFKTGITMNYSNVMQNGPIVSQGQVASSNPTSYLLATAWMYRPVSPFLRTDLLNDAVDAESVTQSDVRINPLISQQNQYNFNKTALVEANGYVDAAITKDISFRTTAGIRHNRVTAESFYNSLTAQASPYNINNQNGIYGNIRNVTTNFFTNTNSLNYKHTFAEKHAITALAVFEISSQRSFVDGYGGRLLPNENLGINGLDEGVAYNASSSRSRNTLASYAGRIDYNYNSKYLVTATFRADGSSKFINNKWGYFPSLAIAWNMHNEKFFEGISSVVSASKLRGGYGTTGNNRIADFSAYPSITYDNGTNGYALNNSAGVGGAYISNVGNIDLQWETVKTLDIGYELGFLKNRFSLELDLYRRTTSNLLLTAQLPPTTGFNTAVKNIGELQNDGLEITLNTTNVSNNSFRWQTSFNISFNKNKIMALTSGQRSLATTTPYVSQFGQPLYLAEIGKPAGMMIGYVWLGNYQYEDFDNPSPGVYLLKPNVAGNGSASRTSIQPGDIKYLDLNGDGTMTNADVTIIGRGQPVHSGGISNNFSYKSFDLNIFFQWSYGNNLYNANRLLLEGNSNGYANINQFKTYANRWTPDNPTNANYRTRGQGPIGFHSSRVVEDGSFIRLKTLYLGYTVPARYSKKAFMSNLGLFVSAQNLITWTKYSGLDPEVSIRSSVSGGVNGSVLTPGYDYSSYPKSPVFAFGLKASF